MKKITNKFCAILIIFLTIILLDIKNANCQQLAVSIEPGPTKCTHGADGVLTAIPTGGTIPYTFLWSTGSPFATISNLAPGTYTVTVTDNAGASVTAKYKLYSCCTETYLIEGDVALSSLVGNPYVVQSGNTAIVFTNFNCSPGLPYNTVALNGTLHIDMPCNFLNLELVCGPDAEIIVDQNFYILMGDGCNYLHACGGKMWRGITLTGSQPGQPALIIGADTWIEDAQEAVVSNSDAEYSINNATFNKNHAGVVVNGTGNIHNGIINHTTFGSNILNTNGTLGAPDVCLPPFSGKRSKMGVQIISVGSISVGTIGLLSQPNTFRNLDYGIFIDSRTISSGVTIINNRFVDMPFVSSNSYDNGWGIWCTSTIGFSLFQIASLNLGGVTDPAEPNTFTDCHGGILCNGNTQSVVQNNTFTRCPDNTNVSTVFNGAAIRFRRADRPSYVTIDQNHINNCNRGIHVVNFGNSPVEITFNEINNPPNNIWNTYGINLVNVHPAHGAGSTFIKNNTINYCRTGINLTNSPRTNVGPGNYIGFHFNNPTATTSLRYGVRSQGSGEAYILTNTVERTGSVDPTIAFEDKFFGVSVESADKNTVSSNLIRRMGDAIRFSNVAMQGQTVTCNDMQRNYNGIKLDNADIGNQYFDAGNPAAQDNQWNTYFGNCLKGIGNLFATEFYTQSATFPTVWYPDPNLQFPVSQYPFTFALSSNNCNLPLACADCERQRMAEIINEAGNFTTLSPDQQYTAKKNVFSTLAKDTLQMYFGDSYDVIFRNFYNNSMTGNFGQLLSVYDHISDNDIPEASSINSSINPDNNMEWNEIMLNEIYLATWARDIDELSPEQYDILYNIATQNPITGGLAVYGARVMLDLEVDDVTNEDGGRFSNPGYGISDNESHETAIVNSSSGSFYYSLNNSVTGTLSLYNIFGQLVLKKQLVEQENKIELYSAGLSPGSYFYFVT